MQEPDTLDWVAIPDPPKPGAEPVYDVYVDTGNQRLVRRALTMARHGYGLALGALAAYLRELPARERRRPRTLLLRAISGVAGLPVDRRLRREPFPVQLRCRFERLGSTYIKLGQILSTREDLLPRSVTDELKKLLDRLPAVPYPSFVASLAEQLGRPVDDVFVHISSTPLGSASIGQTHRATLHGGAQVVIKMVKPGVRETLKRDTLLLRGLGSLLQLFLRPYQPRRVIGEFSAYTLREADLTLEADHAETFASNFEDQPDIVFPRIYRDYSNENLLVMEYLDGIQPTDPRALTLRPADRERLVELGAEAIICMLYRDGFFHADLHPANLIVLPGPRCGFVDLGMVGRFDTELRHTLLYYYYSLVTGDAESAASYLASVAQAGPGANPSGFRRDVEDICRQWSQRARFSQFSLARLTLQSVARGARHRMYFPMEMVLMVKAIVTYEAVGQMLMPGFDVAKVSRQHLNRIILQRFAPLRLAQESLTALPELLDALAKTPRLLTEGLRLVEQSTRQPAENPFAGVRATLYGGFCLVAGAILAAFGGPWPVWTVLLLIGLLLPLRPGR